ncbi:MAG: cyclic nucleotide-binding domain-containing protein, partial [Anaerolineales bacterium]
METIEQLESVEIFDGLSKQELLQIAAICSVVEFKAGEKITVQDSDGDDLFIIAAGFVEVNVQLRDGSPKSIVNLGPGQLIGEMALIDRGPRSATVIALNQPTILYRIVQQDFEALC